MKKLMLAVLLLFCSGVFAQVNSGNTCTGVAIPAGGHDTFPWSIAKPFPWTSIQGVWTVANASKEQESLVFEFKVTRTTDKLKQLFVEIYDRENCKKAAMRGVGVVNTAERNVVRVNLNNVLMKLAMFNTADLEMDTNTCGPKTLGATFYRLIDNKNLPANLKSGTETINTEESSNMILKKISNALDFRCKK